MLWASTAHEIVELRLIRAEVKDLAVQHGVDGIPAAASDSQSAGKDLYTLPLRETRRTVPPSKYASARKPSYFTSNSQSGWSKASRSCTSGTGMILGIRQPIPV